MKIKGRPSKYMQGLKNSDYWQEVRIDVKLRDHHHCRNCGGAINLECHHIAYFVGNVSIVGIEKRYLQWVVTVCHDCHQNIHSDLRHKWNPKNPWKTPVTEADFPTVKSQPTGRTKFGFMLQ